MRPIRTWALYLVVVFVGGALLAPWLRTFVQEGATVLPALQPLARMPFHRYVHRCLLLLAVGGLWPLMRALGVCSAPKIGVAVPAGWVRRWAVGFALGCASVAGVFVLAMGAHGRSWNVEHSFTDVVVRVGSAGLTAAVVAPMEEILFRGVLFGSLRRAHGWRIGLVASSLIYALTHFFKPVLWDGPVSWETGLVVLGRMMRGMVDPAALVPGFLSLALAGALLALAYQRTGDLWCSVGLHGGWILWMESLAFVTQDVSGAKVWFWGTGWLVDGWLASSALVALGLIMWKCVLPGVEPEGKHGERGGAVGSNIA